MKRTQGTQRERQGRPRVRQPENIEDRQITSTGNYYSIALSHYFRY